MLARRVYTRLATTVRRGSQPQRRFIHISSSQLHTLPSPNKARSIIVALEKFMGFATTIGCFWVAYHTVKKLEDELDDNKKKLDDKMKTDLLAKMIHIQQMDITYDSVNFDDPISTLSYFTKICQPFTPDSEEELNRSFKILMMRIDKKTMDGSTISAEIQAQHIMRSAAEKMHGVFREFNRDSVASTSKLASLVVKEAIESLLYLMYEDDSFSDWGILSG